MRRCHVWFQLCLMVPPLGIAEPRSHTSGTLGKTYLRKVKTLGSSLRERNISADRHQSQRRRGRECSRCQNRFFLFHPCKGFSGVSILLQPMEGATVEQMSALQPMENPTLEQRILPKGSTACGGSMLEHVLQGGTVAFGGHMLEQAYPKGPQLVENIHA